MTLRDLVIAICFLGCLYLTIIGGWNYMVGRIETHQEQLKIDQLIATRRPFLDAEEALKKLKKEKNNALLMFAAGFVGIYLTIAFMNRRRKKQFYLKHKPTEQ